MQCPKCKSKNYNFRKNKNGIIWYCKDCKFKRINKTAEVLLKEDPISGALKREINKLEQEFDHKNDEKKKTVTAEDVIKYIKSKKKRFEITKRKNGYILSKKGDRIMEVIDRKKWLALYLKEKNFKVEKIYNNEEMSKVIDDVI